MRIDILTLFPLMFDGFLNTSIIKRGIDNKLFEINIHDFREYSTNKHKKVDDTIYGGGAGMLISVEPIVRCLRSIEGYQDAYVILMDPTGTKYEQSKAQSFSKKEHIIVICGHYEGIDARIDNYINEKVSIGDFVLTGGEVASMAICDSIVRLIPGVISDESTISESFNNSLLEYDQYTKPANFEGLEVPSVLQSGDHEKIRLWKMENAIEKTYRLRKDLINEDTLSKEEKEVLNKVKTYQNCLKK